MPRRETIAAIKPTEFTSTSSAPEVRHELDDYVDLICSHLPNWFSRMIVWLRRPSRWPLRIFVSLLLVIGGLLAFLPVFGLWMLPLGLVIIAQDLPFLERPLLRAFQWADRRSRAWRRTHGTAENG